VAGTCGAHRGEWGWGVGQRIVVKGDGHGAGEMGGGG